MMLQVVVVYFAFFIVLGNSAERGDECIDQSGKKAICTSIHSCKITVESLNNSTIGDKIYISGSICGRDKEPLVCCQTENSTNSTKIPTTTLKSNEPNDSERKLYTSATLVQEFTKITTEANYNNPSDNTIESNSIPEVLPLQSNNLAQTTTISSTSIPTTPPPLPSPNLIETTTSYPTISKNLPPPKIFFNSKKLNKLLPDRNTCGFQNSRQTSENSPVSTIDEFPWIALLKYRSRFGYIHDYNAGFRCVGTLISSRYVITAAQCIITNPEDLIYLDCVRLGEWLIPSQNDCIYNYNGQECADKIVDVGIEKKIAHPDYDPSCGLNNIGLISLERNIDYSAFIRPICLPIENLLEPTSDTVLTTSGWGVTRYGYQLDLKSKINLPVLSKEKCINIFANFRQLLENQLCAGTTTSNNICLTDSGGPLMVISYEDKPQWYLEGVIPEGFACNQQHAPGVYTRVTRYMKWILDIISKDNLSL